MHLIKDKSVPNNRYTQALHPDKLLLVHHNDKKYHSVI